MELAVSKILLPALLAFAVGILLTPIVAHFLYTYKVWKKTGGKTTSYGHTAHEFNRLKGATETSTPRMGGIVIWGSIVLTTGLLFVLDMLFTAPLFSELNFINRSQTWIPLAALLAGALVGFINDFYDVTRGGKGLLLRYRLCIISALAALLGWWLYTKLGITSINIPLLGPWEIGWFIIPFCVFVTNALYASGVIDGIDGLSGGVFSAVFSSYAGIALLQGQFDIAAFCATVAGAILAFTWFNIPPARFWMTETGSMALTLTLAVVVFMTDTLGGGYGIVLFGIVGIPLIATVASNVLQITWRKVCNKKLLRIAPLHHHFEALGWPPYKVTMRYWIISIFCAITGIVIAALL